jgi:hypothetical protein
VASKSLSLNNFLADMGLDTAEYRFGSVEMWAIWRE